MTSVQVALLLYPSLLRRFSTTMTAPFVTTLTKPVPDTPASRRLRRLLLLLVLLLLLLLVCTLLTWLLVPSSKQVATHWLNRMFYGNVIDETCTLPREVGPCRAGKPRFYFDASTGTCTPFLYGGCEGNANRFETMKQCVEKCGSVKIGAEGPKQDGSGPEVHQGAALCSLPAVVGNCKAAVPRFHFDSETSQCKEFTYGGCGGNANNFETLESCQHVCATSNRSGEGEQDCTSTPEGGLCMAYMERYAYNPSTGACQMFVYGGCGGNGNRYTTKEECEKRCRTPAAERPGAGAGEDSEEHGTRLCGVTECPADCGLVSKDGDCVLCQCDQRPFLAAGQVAVSGEEGCPHGYTEVRRDFSAVVCAKAVPVASP